MDLKIRCFAYVLNLRLPIAFVLILFACNQSQPTQSKADRKVKESSLVNDTSLLAYTIDLSNSELDFYYQNEQHQNFKNFKKLKDWLKRKNKSLVFAVNGGMYYKDSSPQGLYIENGKIINEIDLKKNGYGNFYLQPNGIFYLTFDDEAFVTTAERFSENANIKYATQSGPLLLIEGKIHPKFRKGSKNMHIRNGVGILPDGRLLFVMSKRKINFYDFALFFKKNRCKNALYLDGFVSKTYLPEKNYFQMEGNFGVIIAETK